MSLNWAMFSSPAINIKLYSTALAMFNNLFQILNIKKISREYFFSKIVPYFFN